MHKPIMIQWLLLDTTNLKQKKVSVENIKAVFTNIGGKAYEVLLEISSHKFFINIKRNEKEIQNFEIIASKWYINLNNESVTTLRNLIDHLRYR